MIESASPGCRSRRRGRLQGPASWSAGLRVRSDVRWIADARADRSTSRCVCPNDGCATRMELRRPLAGSLQTRDSRHDDHSFPTSSPHPFGTHRNHPLSRLTIVPANHARLFFSRNLPTGVLLSLNIPAVQPNTPFSRCSSCSCRCQITPSGDLCICPSGPSWSVDLDRPRTGCARLGRCSFGSVGPSRS